jgi:hypothetical protein
MPSLFAKAIPAFFLTMISVMLLSSRQIVAKRIFQVRFVVEIALPVACLRASIIDMCVCCACLVKAQMSK